MAQFKLPELPYKAADLAPHITTNVMEFHYGAHHKAYVDNLNKLIPGTEFEKMSLEDMMLKSSGGIFNNAAQCWNHTFYWWNLCPKGNELKNEKLKKAIESKWGSMDAFKEAFMKDAKGLFGSGWVWLVKSASGELSLVSTGNADNPLQKGLTPIMTCDVWEHAYYLDYKNRRDLYLEGFWKLLNWDYVAQNFESTKVADMTSVMRA